MADWSDGSSGGHRGARTGGRLVIPTSRLRGAALASAYTQRFFYDVDRPRPGADGVPPYPAGACDQSRRKPRRISRVRSSRGTCATVFPTSAPSPTFGAPCSINPNLAEAYIELGKVYLHIGLTDKAVDANEQAQRLDPRRCGVDEPKGSSALIDAGRLEEVRHELERNGTRLLRLDTELDASACARATGRNAVEVLRPWMSDGGWRPGIRRCPRSPCSAVAYASTRPSGRTLERTMAAAIPCGGEPDRAFPHASRAISHWKHACHSSAVTTTPCAGSRRPSTRVTTGL